MQREERFKIKKRDEYLDELSSYKKAEILDCFSIGLSALGIAQAFAFNTIDNDAIQQLISIAPALCSIGGILGSISLLKCIEGKAILNSKIEEIENELKLYDEQERGGKSL